MHELYRFFRHGLWWLLFDRTVTWEFPDNHTRIEKLSFFRAWSYARPRGLLFRFLRPANCGHCERMPWRREPTAIMLNCPEHGKIVFGGERDK